MKEVTITTLENGYSINCLNEKSTDASDRVKRYVVETHGDPRAEIGSVLDRVKEYLIS